MILFFVILTSLFLVIISYKCLSKGKRSTKEKRDSNLRFSDWMELSKKDRQEIDYIYKYEMMRKKKELLKSIREEYLRIKKK